MPVVSGAWGLPAPLASLALAAGCPWRPSLGRGAPASLVSRCCRSAAAQLFSVGDGAPPAPWVPSCPVSVCDVSLTSLLHTWFGLGAGVTEAFA